LNWLDFFMVISQIMEGWLLPCFNQRALPQLSTASRCLRIFSALRCLHLLKAFVRSNMAWSDGIGVGLVFMGCRILFNIVSVRNGTDMRLRCADPESLDCAANHSHIGPPDFICLAIYIVELAMCLHVYRCMFVTVPHCWSSLWQNLWAVSSMMPLETKSTQTRRK